QTKIDLIFDLNFESNKYKAIFNIKSLLGNKIKEIIKEKEINLKKDTCLTCSRISGNYYTTILQLRFNNKKFMEIVEEKILKEIETIIDNINEKTNKISATIHVVREEKQKTGTDLYLDNLKISYNIVKHLMKHKIAKEYKTSKTLVGVSKDGQRVYRTTFCIHFKDLNEN
ncbi:MAG: NMD3-related protein, partial [Candidatus ainarchaeum sp.]|nr:NMD3-related protein [Candidatus ainarchaeum sp.]